MADLRDLKPGDAVTIVETWPVRRVIYHATVDRVTATQIVAGGERFHRDTGAFRNRLYRYRRIEPMETA